jgi:hypothetical protein
VTDNTNPPPKLNKFKIGDKVTTQFNNSYTIKKLTRTSGSWEYVCVGDSGTEFTMPESSLMFNDIFHKSPKPVSLDTLPALCPICRTNWKKTVYGAFIWMDCITCNKTAEKIMQEEEDRVRSSTAYSYHKYY